MTRRRVTFTEQVMRFLQSLRYWAAYASHRGPSVMERTSFVQREGRLAWDCYPSSRPELGGKCTDGIRGSGSTWGAQPELRAQFVGDGSENWTKPIRPIRRRSWW